MMMSQPNCFEVVLFSDLGLLILLLLGVVGGFGFWVTHVLYHRLVRVLPITGGGFTALPYSVMVFVGSVRLVFSLKI